MERHRRFRSTRGSRRHAFAWLAIASLGVVPALRAAPQAPERAADALWTEGRVVDWRGLPFAGATVSIVTRDGRTLGHGVSEPDGRFTFPVGPRVPGELEIHVGGEGLTGPVAVLAWKDLASLGDLSAEHVVDDATLAALVASTDSQAREARIDELLATRRYALDLVFPYLGALRGDLRAAAGRATVDASGSRLSDEALDLLAVWGDPRDSDLLAAFSSDSWGFRTPPSEPIVGSTPSEVCAHWAAVHFVHEHVQGDPPPYSCSVLRADPTNTHAVMLFGVVYAHWRYDMWLVLERDSATAPWHVRQAINNEIT